MKARLYTSHGPIDIELNPDKAPKTVENFVAYVNDGHYDGTIFHRVIKGFMIQGGGFEPGMKEKSTRDTITNEADNGLKNATGSIAMARRPDPHSASAQFFINTKDNGFLDYRSSTGDGWGYCVFGQVVVGQDVVTRIEASSTRNSGGHGDVPVEDVVIEKAELLDG